MDPRALIFDISRTDDTEWLARLREDVEASECCAEDDRLEIRAAIDARFSQLNALALAKRLGAQGGIEQ